MRRRVIIPIEKNAAGGYVYPDPGHYEPQPSIVTADANGNEIEVPQPDRWVSHWRNTRLEGDAHIVGDYLGDDATLPDFTGVEPRDYRHYRTRFRRDEFLDLFDGAELDRLNDYFASRGAFTGGTPSTALTALRERILLRNGWFDVTDAEYINTVGLLLAEGVIDADLQDRLLYGVPRR